MTGPPQEARISEPLRSHPPHPAPLLCPPDGGDSAAGHVTPLSPLGRWWAWPARSPSHQPWESIACPWSSRATTTLPSLRAWASPRQCWAALAPRPGKVLVRVSAPGPHLGSHQELKEMARQPPGSEGRPSISSSKHKGWVHGSSKDGDPEAQREAPGAPLRLAALSGG